MHSFHQILTQNPPCTLRGRRLGLQRAPPQEPGEAVFGLQRDTVPAGDSFVRQRGAEQQEGLHAARAIGGSWQVG